MNPVKLQFCFCRETNSAVLVLTGGVSHGLYSFLCQNGSIVYILTLQLPSVHNRR